MKPAVAQLPVGWAWRPLWSITNFTTGWTPPTGDDASYLGELPWANISDLGPKHLSETQKTISADAARASRIPLSPRGSLLFSFKLSIGQVSIVGRDMYTNEAIATFRSSPHIDTRFAYYSFPITLVANANENIYGAKLLNAQLIRSARIPLPPLEEQRRIAEFLDRETAQIDELIAKQEQLISTLAERFQSELDHLVLGHHSEDRQRLDYGRLQSIPSRCTRQSPW